MRYVNLYYLLAYLLTSTASLAADNSKGFSRWKILIKVDSSLYTFSFKTWQSSDFWSALWECSGQGCVEVTYTIILYKFLVHIWGFFKNPKPSHFYNVTKLGISLLPISTDILWSVVLYYDFIVHCFNYSLHCYQSQTAINAAFHVCLINRLWVQLKATYCRSWVST